MGTDGKKYVADIIGEDYRNWKPKDRILITAPTGSGKTFFVLKRLLNRSIEYNENILYLVNRKILKKQLEEEKKNIFIEMMGDNPNIANTIKEKITFLTYQKLENDILNMDPWHVNQKMIQMRNKYQIVIYDECHYFYADSNFNTYTELSYDFLSHCFQDKIQVFMSATMKNVEKVLREKRNFYYRKNPQYPSLETVPYILDNQDLSVPKKFRSDADYSYVRVKMFKTMEDVEQVIKKSVINQREKWLVFVDNKDYGKSLEKKLSLGTDSDGKNRIAEDEIVYIDADYYDDYDAMDSVTQLAEEKLIKKKVVIATAVMDNGVSFHDDKLRNLVIMADTEEEFIQMLGRKRWDEEEVTVYICQRDQKYFKKRLQYVNAKIDAYTQYGTILDCMYQTSIPRTTQDWQSVDEVIDIGSFGSYRSALETPIGPSVYGQQKVLYKIFQSELLYQNMKTFVYSYQGTLACNKFSRNKLFNLQKFYKEMVDAMETDDMAFMKRQASWIGLEEGDIEYAIVESEREIRERIRKKIEEELKQYVGEELDSDKNKALKKRIRDDLKYFLTDKNGFNKNEIENIPKTDRCITPEQFNKFMTILELPYKMTKPSGGSYKIEGIE